MKRMVLAVGVVLLVGGTALGAEAPAPNGTIPLAEVDVLRLEKAQLVYENLSLQAEIARLQAILQAHDIAALGQVGSDYTLDLKQRAWVRKPAAAPPAPTKMPPGTNLDR